MKTPGDGSCKSGRTGPGVGRSAASTVSEDDTRSSRRHACAARCWWRQHGEDQRVLGKPEGAEAAPGRNRDRRSPPPDMTQWCWAFVSSRKIAIPHAQLKHGDRCRSARKQRIRAERAKVLVRLWGSLRCAVYSLERLRCGACDRCIRARAGRSRSRKIRRDGADDRATQVCSGTPFYRWNTPRSAGDSLPRRRNGSGRRGGRVTQTGARRVNPQAAQGEVYTTTTPACECYISRANRRRAHGVFTSGIVSTSQVGRLRCTSPDASMPARTSPTCCSSGPTRGPAHPDVDRSRAMFRSWLKEWRFYWQTASPRKKTVRGSSGELSRSMSLCTGNAGEVYGHDPKRGSVV